MALPSPRPGFAAVATGRRWLNDGASALAGRARRQPALRAIGTAWGRLLDEACALLAPAAARFAGVDRLVAVPRATAGFDLYRVTRSGMIPVNPPASEAGRPGGRAELRLRADQVLERSLTLPGASRDYLPTIIDHRLDRLTPWRRDRVVYGYAVTGELERGATLQVRVVLASADLVRDLTASLRASGFEPAGIGIGAEDPSRPSPIRLGGAGDAERPAWQRRFGRVWLVGTASLSGLAVVSTLWAMAADDRRMDAERQLTKARLLIREAAVGGSTATDPAFADKRPETATVVLVDTLATTLPDTTYLRELSLTPHEVRLAGTSADAPALIPLLEKAGLFDVRFTAPVSRGDDRKDTFEITAERAPATPEAP